VLSHISIRAYKHIYYMPKCLHTYRHRHGQINCMLHAFTYIHTYTYTRAYIHTNINTHPRQQFSHSCVSVLVFRCVWVCSCALACVCMRVLVCVSTHTYPGNTLHAATHDYTHCARKQKCEAKTSTKFWLLTCTVTEKRNGTGA